MPTSQNGYSANDRSLIASYDLPGGKVALRKGDVSVVLLWWAMEWHRTVEPLRWPGIWGYAERPIRGQTEVLSNHASGTAIDCNAPSHPLGVAVAKTLTPAKVAAIRAMVDFCEGVVRWGGDYSGRVDSMHGEIVKGTAAVKRLADKIRALAAQPVAAVEKAPPGPLGSGTRQPNRLPLIKQGATGGWVGLIQKCVGLRGDQIDEDFGPSTQNAVVFHQRAVFPNDPRQWDGDVGMLTWVSFIYRAGDPLSRGASGPGVEVLQNIVGAATDGDFGETTEAQVAETQRWGGLKPDGVVGEVTRGMYERA